MVERTLANKWLAAFGLLAALTSPSCAGKSRTDGEATSGNGGAASGGAASTAGGSSAGAPSTTCPGERPEPGDYCNYEGLNLCSYELDQCSSLSFQCVAHAWRELQVAGGASPDCNAYSPSSAPRDGDTCNCLGKLDCTFLDCDGRGQIHAVCDNTSWHVQAAPCAQHACGPDGLTCAAGEICVRHDGSAAGYKCAADPCGAATTSCACAASLCASFEQCSLFDGTALQCSCPTC